MKLLLAHTHVAIAKRMEASPMNAAHIGRLIAPNQAGRTDVTAAAGWTWAADNEAFQASGFPEGLWLAMLERIEGLPGCEFVVLPDFVGNAAETTKLFERYSDVVDASGQPKGYALQDGVTDDMIPWDDCAAIFIGGSTEFKYSDTVANIVAEARYRGKWVHMGRVNTLGRMRYAASIGCDSIDGTKWVRWADTYAHELHALPYTQGALDFEVEAVRP